MILDEYNEFCDASAALTTADTEGVCGDVVPLFGATNYPSHLSKPLYCVIRVNTAFAGTNADVIFRIKSSSLADLADAGGTPLTHWLSDPIAVATLVAGYTVFAGPLPGGAYEKYLGVTTLSDETLTAGKLDAFLTADYNDYRAYADAI